MYSSAVRVTEKPRRLYTFELASATVVICKSVMMMDIVRSNTLKSIKIVILFVVLHVSRLFYFTLVIKTVHVTVTKKVWYLA